MDPSTPTPSPFGSVATANLPTQYQDFKRLFDLSDTDCQILYWVGTEMMQKAFATRTIAQQQMLSLNDIGVRVSELKRVCTSYARKKNRELSAYYARNHRPKQSYAHGLDIAQDAWGDDTYAELKEAQDLREVWIAHLDELYWQVKDRKDTLKEIYGDVARG